MTTEAIGDWVAWGLFLFGVVLNSTVLPLTPAEEKPQSKSTESSCSQLEQDVENLVAAIDKQSEEPVAECPICMDERKLITLHPCKHKTCPSCILQMKKTSIDSGEYLQFSCPLCRQIPEEISFHRRGSLQRLPFVINKGANDCA